MTSDLSTLSAQVVNLRPTAVKEPDIVFQRRLLRVLTEATINDDGSYNSDPMLRAILLRPNEASIFARRLAMLFSDKQIQAVVGCDTIGFALAHHVASALTECYADERQVSAFTVHCEGGRTVFPAFLNAKHELRGKHILLIDPILTQERVACNLGAIQAIEELQNNATAFSLGTVYQLGDVTGFRNNLKVEALMDLRLNC